MSTYRKEQHAKNPEKVRAQWRSDHERHRAARLVRMKRYHASHREEHKANMRAWYQKNREELVEYDRARWTGKRRETMNIRRGDQFQQTRLTSPWKWLLKGAEERAQKKGVPFALTEEWASKNWTGRCALTGMEFWLGQRGSGPKTYSPSIDRIKPALGYVPENCRFVLWAINAFKGEGTDEDLLAIAMAIVVNMSKVQPKVA